MTINGTRRAALISFASCAASIEQAANVKKSLANLEPSTHGTSATSQRDLATSIPICDISAQFLL
jgi:hypothetical protein